MPALKIWEGLGPFPNLKMYLLELSMRMFNFQARAQP